MEVFKLFGSIFVDNEKANESIAKTDEKAGGLADKLGTGIKTAAKWGTAIVGAATAVGGAMVNSAKETASNLDVVDKASQRMSITAEAYQKLAYAADLSGVSMTTMEKANKQLKANMGDNADLQTYLMTLANMSDEHERNAKAAELFGTKTAQDLIPLLNAGGQGIKDMGDEAERLGLVMSNDTVKAGAEMNDTFSKLEGSLTSVKNQIGAAVTPVVNDLLNALLDNMPMIQDMIGQLTPVIANVAQQLLPPLMDLVQQILPVIVDLCMQLLPIISNLAQALMPIITDILKALMPILEPILSALGDLLEVIVPPLTKVISLLATVITSELSAAFEALKPIIDNITGIFKGLMTFITGVFTGNWKQAWEGVRDIFKNVFEGLVNIVKLPLNTIIGAINKVFAKIGSITVPSWVPGLGGAHLDLPQIPLLAKGGHISASGSAIVGEAGPEMVEMPTGAKVTPLGGDSFTEKMDRVLDLLEEFMPMVGQGQLVLDTGVVAGAIAPDIDKRLGKISARRI